MQTIKFILKETVSVLKSVEINDPITTGIIHKIAEDFVQTAKNNFCKSPIAVIKYENKEIVIPVYEDCFSFNFQILFGMGKLIFPSKVDPFSFTKNEHILTIIRRFGWKADNISRAQYDITLLNKKKILEEKSKQQVPKKNLIDFAAKKQLAPKKCSHPKAQISTDRRTVIHTNSYAEKTRMDYVSQSPYKQKNYTNVPITN